MLFIRSRPFLAAQGFVVLAIAACDAPVTPPPPAPPPAAPAFTPVPAVVDVRLPYDAAPSPDGSVIFYTALGSDDETHSLWSVPFGGGNASELATGFAAPLGIAVSPTEELVYVGDSADERLDESELGDQDLGTGALFTVPFAGGAPTRITSVDGFSIRAMEIDDAGTSLWFTGKDPADGAPAVAQLALDDNTVTVVAKGEPLADPNGIAIDGEIAYVVDTSASPDGNAAVMKVDGSDVIALAGGIRAGMPAGIALNGDRTALFVSSLDKDNNAQVTVVDIATGATSTVNDGLEGNDEAGGLHRARDTESFAWAGSSTVYGITFTTSDTGPVER